ncbi:MAG: DUF3524 domain-containing protein [Lentisphaerae bacterium]|nr:DUF3524 domain-containing protein [Lentisphaerota bacterium]
MTSGPTNLPPPLRVLALEPYYGGSHRAFLDGWAQRSRHNWTLMGLPPTKWKWRMRHAALTFSEQVAAAIAKGESWDIIFTSDMLGLADFRGLAPRPLRNLPAIVYFHENQLTYPVLEESERDYHFVMSNLTTALAAERVWFNSAFHRDSFLEALTTFLKRMPDYQPLNAISAIRDKSVIHPPCINAPTQPEKRDGGPLHILWVARWEHDKCPERFFKALELMAAESVAFRVSVIGGTPSRRPLPIFEWAREHFDARIVHWGYQESRESYLRVLGEADVVVSTADHEFFGIGMLEAVASGAYPLVPNRLAYPEVFTGTDQAGMDSFFYDGDERELARRLTLLAARKTGGDLWQGQPDRARRVAQRFAWESSVPAWDDALTASTLRCETS